VTLLTIDAETVKTLKLFRVKDESDEALLKRIVELARCFMIVRGADASNRLVPSLEGSEHGAK